MQDGAVQMKLAVIFQSPPHGSAKGREGLDALLAMSAFIEDPAVIFTGDGIYQLKKNQQPDAVLSRDHAKTFGVLKLYDIQRIYVPSDDLTDRFLSPDELILPVKAVSRDFCRSIIESADYKMVF
jgi:tRNA 2-thiouridine synthesizing protein C